MADTRGEKCGKSIGKKAQNVYLTRHFPAIMLYSKRTFGEETLWMVRGP